MPTSTQPPVDNHSRQPDITRIPLWTGPLPEIDLTATPRPGRFVAVSTRFGPARVHLRESSGPSGAEPAVYLHGLAGSSTNWTDLARLLATRLPGVAVDLPGFGLSEPPEGFDFGRRAHAEVVIALLDVLGSGPVHLFGNSFGGAVALDVAALRPDLVSTLTLVSPAMPDLRVDPRRVSDPRLALAPVPLLGRRARRRLAGEGPRERTLRLLRLVFANPDAIPPHRVSEAVQELTERAHLPWAGPALSRTTSALLRSWVNPRPETLWQLARRVEVPALVAWGERDRVVSVGKAPRTTVTLPRGRLLVLPRTGHVAQMERPLPLARAALGMIDAVRSDRW